MADRTRRTHRRQAPRAVDRLSDFVVLLEQRDVVAGFGYEACRVKTTRSASDDRNVQHLLVCFFQMRTGPARLERRL